jgi:hypothetical protein
MALGIVKQRAKKPRRSADRSGGAGTEKRPIQFRKLIYWTGVVNHKSTKKFKINPVY